MAKNSSKLHRNMGTLGEKVSDIFTSTIGTWAFILIQTAILIVWVILNVTAYIRQWDPYPFILLNLVLSLEAAYAAPVLMMSQNRQNAKDRLKNRMDLETDKKAEEEIQEIQEYLHRIENKKLNDIKLAIEKINKKLDEREAR